MTSQTARVARHKRHTIGIFLHRVHRWMGVAVSLFVVFLVLTGWALNHTAELGLARISVQVPWITAWYGLRGAVPATGYTARGHWLISDENGTLLDGKKPSFELRNAIGMIATDDLIAIAGRTELALVDNTGRLIDRIASNQLPINPIEKIGLSEQHIVLQSTSAFASTDGVNWQPFQGDAVWSVSQALPPDQQAHAKQLAPSLPFERIMQDLHSGRILGHYGPYLMDAVGLLFLLLAGSGLWMFFRRPRR